MLDLPALVRAHLERGERTVLIPGGTHRLPETGVKLTGLSDVVIDGKGATLLATSFKNNAFHLKDCRNVTLRGFTLDYDPLPFTQATIIRRADDGSWMEFRVHDGYAAFDGEYAVRRAHVFDGETRLWKKNAPDLYPTAVRMTGPREGRIELDVPADRVREIRPGDYLAFNIRRAAGMMLAGCENICIEDVTIHAASGGAIGARFLAGEKNIFRRITISRGPTPRGATEPRLLSSSADGINYAYSRHGPLIEQCDFSFMGDDSINLHGFSLPIIKRDGPRVLWAVRPVAGDPLELVVRAGDEIRLLDADTFAPGESFVIRSCERTDLPGDWAAMARALFPSFRQQGELAFFKITLDRDCTAAEGVFFDIPATFSSHYVIRDCYFHDHRAHGTRIMASHGMIENNRIERVRGTAIGLAAEYSHWREAGWPRHVRVTGNIIRDAGQGAGFGRDVSPHIRGAISLYANLKPNVTPAPGCMRDIVIEDNDIEVKDITAIDINAASDVVVRNNRIKILNTGTAPSACPPLGVHHSERVICGRELLVDQTKPDAPYRTLAAAAQDAKPGDTIRIAQNTGPYRETLYIKQSGAPGAPITVDGGDNVITGFEPLRFRKAENGAWVSATVIKMPCVITHRGVRLREDAKTGRFTGLATLNDARDTLTLLPGVSPEGWEISTRYFVVRVQDASHHLYKNIRATGAGNDGFNLHGAGVDLRFENIEGFNNADEGYSSHDNIESSIKGGKFHANDNGFANIGNSATAVENIDVWDNLGYGVCMSKCTFKARGLRAWGNGKAQVYFLSGARVDLENVTAYRPAFTAAPWVSYSESKSRALMPPLTITADVIRLREVNVRVENTPAPAAE